MNAENKREDREPQKPLEVPPLDGIMTRLGLKNHDLVEKSTDQLTHKMVAKGRKGKKLTLNAKLKILKALNAAQTQKVFSLQELFNASSA